MPAEPHRAGEQLGPSAVPHAVAARAHAGALFALLRWWIAGGASYTPERMDEMFHAMRFPTE